MGKRTWLRGCCTGLLLAACTPPPSSAVELHSGARVQFSAAGWSAWTPAIVGKVGNCTALMVPASWDTAASFRIVRLDSVQGLRISTRYDGRTGTDGERRTVKLPPDTAGEEWTAVSAEAIRTRHGGCEP